MVQVEAPRSGALARLALGVVVASGVVGGLATVAQAFALGTLLFCGTVYAGALGAPRLGVLAPVGGSLLMLGWALLGLSALRRK